MLQPETEVLKMCCDMQYLKRREVESENQNQSNCRGMDNMTPCSTEVLVRCGCSVDVFFKICLHSKCKALEDVPILITHTADLLL